MSNLEQTFQVVGTLLQYSATFFRKMDFCSLERGNGGEVQNCASYPYCIVVPRQ